MKPKKFNLVWLGEIREDGTEDAGCTIATSKTLEGVRRYAKMKKITDFDHRIEEMGFENVGGFHLETAIAEHKITS